MTASQWLGLAMVAVPFAVLAGLVVRAEGWRTLWEITWPVLAFVAAIAFICVAAALLTGEWVIGGAS